MICGATTHRGILALGAALVPATIAGARAGKRLADRVSDAIFTRLVEAGRVAAGFIFIVNG